MSTSKSTHLTRAEVEEVKQWALAAITGSPFVIPTPAERVVDLTNFLLEMDAALNNGVQTLEGLERGLTRGKWTILRPIIKDMREAMLRESEVKQ